MAKLANLQAQLEKTAGTRPTAVQQVPLTSEEVPRPSSRDGKVHIGAYLSREYRANLHMVQAATGLSTQALIARALNDLFRVYNVPVIDGD